MAVKFTTEEIARELAWNLDQWYAYDGSGFNMQPEAEDDTVFDIPTTTGQRFRVTVQEMK